MAECGGKDVRKPRERQNANRKEASLSSASSHAIFRWSHLFCHGTKMPLGVWASSLVFGADISSSFWFLSSWDCHFQIEGGRKGEKKIPREIRESEYFQGGKRISRHGIGAAKETRAPLQLCDHGMKIESDTKYLPVTQIGLIRVPRLQFTYWRKKHYIEKKFPI